MGDPVERSGSGAVRVGYRFWDQSGANMLTDYGDRTDLPAPIQPGQRIDLLVSVVAPDQPGTYQLQFDLILEQVGWFEANGAPKYLVPVVVVP